MGGGKVKRRKRNAVQFEEEGIPLDRRKELADAVLAAMQAAGFPPQRRPRSLVIAWELDGGIRLWMLGEA